MDTMTLSDIAAVTGNNRESFLGGNGIILLILFFLVMGGFGNNKADLATATQVYDATTQQSVTNKMNDILEAVNKGSYSTARLIDNVNYNMSQNTAAVTQALNCGFNGVNTNINNLSHQLEQCCCNLRSQMLQDKYDAVRNELNLAQIASANAVQTQNVLGQIGRFYVNQPIPNFYNGYGTTIA